MTLLLSLIHIFFECKGVQDSFYFCRRFYGLHRCDHREKLIRIGGKQRRAVRRKLKLQHKMCIRDRYKAKKGESFYFVADKKHYLTSKGGAVILWVSSPPSF